MATVALAAFALEPDPPPVADEVATVATPPAILPYLLEEAAITVETTVDIEDWERLADCESGDWDADGDPKPGSARWDYGLLFDHGDHFQGGLNFHPVTWDAYRDDHMPTHAGRATRLEEILVAERVLEEQGWGAWPVCSAMLDGRVARGVSPPGYPTQ
jgi:resuscitation-promoting factor RpfA